MGTGRLLALHAAWKHLRVLFQLTLSPLFLWGYMLAAGRFHWRFAAGFIAFHLFLYTGITAFNSAYDRDEGPVGGMLAPPPVPDGLLSLSLVLQCLGALIAAAVSMALLKVYLVVALLGVLYSHPAVRWKASPWLSAATVFFGQGACGAAAGWITARGGWGGSDGATGWVAALSAALTTLGLYPLTQVYQIEEDRNRGDRTLAVALGPAGALRFGFAVLVAAGLSAVGALAWRGDRPGAGLVGAAYCWILAEVARFASEFRAGKHSDVSAFRTAMRLNVITSAGFICFTLLRLLRK